MDPEELELERQRALARARARMRANQGRQSRWASDMRSWADRRIMPEPARRDQAGFERAAADRISFEEQAEAGMSDTEAGVRNLGPQSRMVAAGPVRAGANFAEGLIDAPARIGAYVLEHPVETLTYPLTAGGRLIQGYTGGGIGLSDAPEHQGTWLGQPTERSLPEEILAGRSGHAMDRAIETAAPAMEMALLTSPARAPGRTAPRPRAPLVRDGSLTSPQPPSFPRSRLPVVEPSQMPYRDGLPRGPGLRNRVPNRVAQAVEDFDRSGVEPYVAAATADTVAGGLAGPLTKATTENPYGGILARGQVQRRMQQAEASADRQAAQYSPFVREPQAGGRALREGVEEFSRTRFPAEANRRFNAVDAQVRRSAATSTRNTRRALGRINTPFRSALLNEATRNPRMQGFQEIFENTARPGELSGTSFHFNDLQRFRTEIRRMRTEDSPLMRTARDSDLAMLESALTADIYAGIQGAARAMFRRNDPARDAAALQALADLQAANSWYRATARVIRQDLERYNTRTDEMAFTRLRTALQDRGRGSVREVRALREALTQEQWRDVAATILHDLASSGRGNQFSPTSWATAWEKLTPEAKNLLFGDRYSVARENLDAFGRTMARMREAESYANTSRSFMGAQAVGSTAAIAAAPATMGLLHAAWAVGGRLLMSPGFTRLLAGGTAAQQLGVDAAVLYGRQYATIVALARLEPEFKADYEALLELLPPPQDRLPVGQRSPALLPAPAPPQ